MDAYSEASLRAVLGKETVIVDFTADWCLTCKVNEHAVLSDARVRAALAEQGFVTFIGDWTRRDDAITAFLKSFGYQGVPLNVYFPPGGEPVVLPQILTEDIILSTIQ